MEVFDAYFRRADLDQDGRISGAEAVAFFQGSNLPKPVLAQIWMHADQNRTGFLGRPEFYNALRLVTVAQSGRELTPDIVKAALFGPAAAKIPPPQINPASVPATQMNSMPTPPQLGSAVQSSTQMGVVPPTNQNLAFRGPQVRPNLGMNQQAPPSSINHSMRPPQGTPAVASFPVQGVNQGLPGGGNMAVPRPLSSNAPNSSTDWLGSAISGAPVKGTTGTTPGLPPRPHTLPASATAVSSKPATVLPQSQSSGKDSKALVLSGNGFSLDSGFGGGSSTNQAKPDTLTPTFSTSTVPNATSVTAGSQNSTKASQVDPFQGFLTMPHGGSQLQQAQSLVTQNQRDTTQSTSASSASHASVGPNSSAANQPQLQWPRITQPDIKKYTNVFVEVDKDRDGKITGEQARNLFLSWRLPREVLKQVWDLSDEDNDSMLSLREFCIALYLMERFREGLPLPAVLPNTLRFDETLLRATGQPSTAYGGPSWQPSPGFSQQGIPGSRPVMSASGVRPPIHPSIASQTAPLQHKSGFTTMYEKNLPNQLNTEQQNMATSMSQDATDGSNKAQEVEKILDSKEKVEFYRNKMQELVLYKSRCDNRLNEITERASADKREVESLAKKYEERYKQVAEVASKLTVEEATFRDVQERKLELQNAILKIEQGGSVDGLLQVRADRIQSDLDDLVKALNQRCNHHGINVKSTASVDLPFGWQPGIPEAAASWDEEWDKFEDEGFSIVRELSAEVKDDVNPANSRSPSVWSDKTIADDVSPPASSSHIFSNGEKPYSTGEQITERGSAYAFSEDGSARSPPASPGRSAFDSPPREFHSPVHDNSPHAKDTFSDHGGAESSIFGDNYADESSWGANFDNNDDMDSVWGFNAKDGQNSFFGSGDYGLSPIKVDSPSAGSDSGKKKSTFFEDSVPSSPLFNSSSPLRFNEGHSSHSFDTSSRFDSFSMRDGGIFQQRESLQRFDSIRSTSDFDHSRDFSFDDSDPFGSTGPFKSSETRSPRKDSDNWRAF